MGVTIALIKPIHGQGYNSDIPRLDAPVIYIGAFPILTARSGRRSIYNKSPGKRNYTHTHTHTQTHTHTHTYIYIYIITNWYPKTSNLIIQQSLSNRLVGEAPLQRGKTLPKKGVLGMSINYTWLWDTNSEALERIEYPFISITPRSTLTQIGSSCLDLTYWSNRCLKTIHIRYEYLVSYNYLKNSQKATQRKKI